MPSKSEIVNYVVTLRKKVKQLEAEKTLIKSMGLKLEIILMDEKIIFVKQIIGELERRFELNFVWSEVNE